MNIVGFMGSPRKNGNTAILLEQLMQGAANAGAQTSIFYPNELNLAGCQGCRACKTAGHCVVQDDMQKVYQAINKADTLIFASPVYMWQMTAQLKLVMDRLYAYLKPDHTNALPKPVKVALVFTQHQPDKELFMPYFKWLARIFKFLGFEPIPEVLVGPGLSEAGEIVNDLTLMSQAYKLGEKLAR